MKARQKHMKFWQAGQVYKISSLELMLTDTALSACFQVCNFEQFQNSPLKTEFSLQSWECAICIKPVKLAITENY